MIKGYYITVGIHAGGYYIFPFGGDWPISFHETRQEADITLDFLESILDGRTKLI